MRGLAILLCFLVCVTSAKSFGKFRGSKVIYGTDDRQDTYELNTFDANLGRSVVIILKGNNIVTENNDGSFTATSTDTAEDYWNYCPEERYSDQLILSNAFSFCSGFLLSTNPPWIGTAAHCIESIDNAIAIFGFELTSASQTRLTFDADAVYNLDSVVLFGSATGGAGDYGIVELDRTVIGYTPYTSVNSNLQVGESLILIGHPSGLPKKTDKGGAVQAVDGDLIRGTVDSYGGNSGSPVFDSEGRLVGLLVGGAPDFVNDDGCDVSNVCPGGSGCNSLGENIVPICVLATADSSVESQLNLCSNTNTPISSGYSTETIVYLPNTISQSPDTLSPDTFSPSTFTFSLSLSSAPSDSSDAVSLFPTIASIIAILLITF